MGGHQRVDVPPWDRILAMFAVQPWPDGVMHAFAREQKVLMLTLVTGLVAELGVEDPQPLAEQLVTLADGAISRAMVLNDPDYGRHARAAAEVLLDHAPRGGRK